METINKNVLEEEISLIKNEAIKTWTRESLSNSPDYFFVAPASSTGKYHPDCTLGNGGLLVHTKRVIYIINRLSAGWGLTDIERDIVLSAGILHDIAKTGRGNGSYEDYINHSLNAQKYLKEMENNSIVKIRSCVEHHMGLWTPEIIKKDIRDYTLLELLVYTADYMATTKDLITPQDKKEA